MDGEAAGIWGEAGQQGPCVLLRCEMRDGGGVRVRGRVVVEDGIGTRGRSATLGLHMSGKILRPGAISTSTHSHGTSSPLLLRSTWGVSTMREGLCGCKENWHSTKHLHTTSLIHVASPSNGRCLGDVVCDVGAVPWKVMVSVGLLN